MDEFLTSLNEEIAGKRLTITIILCIYLFIGVIGNSIVLFVYSCRIKTEDKGNNRYYIPSLAFFDLIAIMTHALSSILQNYYFVTFPSSELCKALWFTSWCSSVISGFILLLISLQRYLLISLNNRTELSNTKLRMLLVVAIFVAAVCTFPTLWFVDIRNVYVELEERNITTAICSFRNDNATKGGEVYFVFMLIGTVLNMIATSTFYFLIGKVIYTKFRKSQKCSFFMFLQACLNDIGDTQSRASLDEAVRPNSQNQKGEVKNDEMNKEYKTSDGDRSRTSFNSIDFTETESNSKENIVDNTKQEKRKGKSMKRTASSRRTRKGKKAKTRFTTMFMLILIIYVISYIPPFVVQFVTGNSLQMLKHTSTTQLNVILFFESTVLINHITNPFVYGYFDVVFRREIKKLLCML